MNLNLLPDKEKVKLTQDDLFDKIINLKITCMDKNNNVEEYVIRSDYEIVFTNNYVGNDFISPTENNKYYIRRCTYKPSIKVQYSMVSANTGITVDVYVSNFYMLTKDGKHLRSFNASDYTMTKVEIAMGYWGQFKKVEESQETVPTIDEYFSKIIIEGRGADSIIVNAPIVVTTEKLPPDSVLHLHGFVGDILSEPVSVSNVKSYSDAEKKPAVSSGTSMEKALYNQITKRYISGQSPFGKKGINVADYKKEDLTKMGISLGEDNLLKDEDAEKYGVKVYLSDKVKSLEIPQIEDGEGNKQDIFVYFESGWTIGQTLARFMSYMDVKLDYRYTNKGSILLYSLEEADDLTSLHDSFTEVYEDSVFETIYDNKLPAVYNINIDALATIVCPYFTFIEPFQTLEFSSRYALTSLVSYFAVYSPTINKFYATRVNISFATTENINEMQITAVSVKEG